MKHIDRAMNTTAKVSDLLETSDGMPYATICLLSEISMSLAAIADSLANMEPHDTTFDKLDILMRGGNKS